MLIDPEEQLSTRSRSAVSRAAGETFVATAKKPYQEPAFRHEKVFETMALRCGKVQDTDFQCRFHKKFS